MPSGTAIGPLQGTTVGAHQHPPVADPPPAGPAPGATGGYDPGPQGVTGWVQGASIILRTADKAVQALCGKTPPALSGGVGGTETVTIPRRRAAVVWNGHPPYQLKLSLIFDGVPRNTHVEDDLAVLRDMATATPGASRPPSVRVSGPIPYHPPIDGWLIESIDETDDELIRREGHTVRLRQSVDVTLIEDNAPEIAVRAKGQQHKRYRRYTTKDGDTLRKLAKRFDVPGGWKQLAALNHIRDPKHLKAGTKLRIPLPWTNRQAVGDESSQASGGAVGPTNPRPGA